MTDTQALKEMIRRKGIKLKYVAEYLGLSPYGIQLKANNKKEFKTSEIMAFCDLLEIRSLEQKEEIFFAREKNPNGQ